MGNSNGRVFNVSGEAHIGTGSESGGLYLFDVDQNGKSMCGLSNSAFVCRVSKKLWHKRLGHPSDQVLSILDHEILKKPNDDEKEPSGDGNEMAYNIHDNPIHVNEEATLATQLDDNNDKSKAIQSNNIGSRSGVESKVLLILAMRHRQ
nr:ribonuclease H-like domain-containing protein [Tanacetum cinerariifolium]